MEYAADVKAAGETPKVYYVTENKDIVAVDQDGKFYATGLGEAKVIAYCGNRKATVLVTVACYTKEISILDSEMEEKDVIEMKGGETEFLTVSFKPYDTTDSRNVTWKIKNKKAATIKNGVLTAKEVKEATETELIVGYKATNAEGKTEKKEKTIKVRITPANPDASSAKDKAYTVTLAKKIQLTTPEANKSDSECQIEVKLKTKKGELPVIVAEAASTNNDVVSVNGISAVDVKGKQGTFKVTVNTKEAGTAYIVVKTKAEGSETVNVQRCKITVTSPAKKLVIKSGTLTVDTSGAQKTMTLRKGTSGTIEAMLDPANSTDLSKLKITASKGVTIKNGVITAKKITDKAVITVKCGKLKETINVTVTK